MKKRFKYTIPTTEEIQNCKYNECLLYEVKDLNTDKVIISFYTNNDLRGCYWYDKISKKYTQSGDFYVWQFSPNREIMRKRLYKVAKTIGTDKEPISAPWSYTCNVK